MVSVDVDSNYCVVEFRVSALKDFIVLVFLIAKGVKPSEKEFKHAT